MNEVYDKKKVNLWFFSGVKQVKKYAIQLFKSKLHHFFTSYNSKTQAKKMFLLNKYLNWKVDLSTEKDYSQFKSTTQKITLFFMEYDVKTGRFGSHFSTKSCKKMTYLIQNISSNIAFIILSKVFIKMHSCFC